MQVCMNVTGEREKKKLSSPGASIYRDSTGHIEWEEQLARDRKRGRKKEREKERKARAGINCASK